MSRVAKSPVKIDSVEVTLNDSNISVKGKKGSLNLEIHQSVEIEKNSDDNVLHFRPKNDNDSNWSYAGTTRSLVNNMVEGVTKGFEKTLLLVGVGYRVQVKGSTVVLSVGYSNPIEHKLPEGITAEAVSQTELKLSGVDKQLVGQAAAEIREYRKPEPYKGKGIKYSDEHIMRKEAKKK